MLLSDASFSLPGFLQVFSYRISLNQNPCMFIHTWLLEELGLIQEIISKFKKLNIKRNGLTMNEGDGGVYYASCASDQ